MSDIQRVDLSKVKAKLAETDDPLAIEIDWEPLVDGGSNFRAQVLRVRGGKVVVEQSTLTIVLIAGLALLAVIFALSALNSVVKLDFFSALFSSIFVVFLGSLAYRSFDGARCFTVDSKSKKITEANFLNKPFGIPDLGRWDFSEIHALQLLRENVTHRDGGRYKSVELNMVAKSGKRINLMDHAKIEDVEQVAKTIASVLNVPVWKGYE